MIYRDDIEEKGQMERDYSPRVSDLEVVFPRPRGYKPSRRVLGVAVAAVLLGLLALAANLPPELNLSSLRDGLAGAYDDTMVAPYRPLSHSPVDDTLLMQARRGGHIESQWFLRHLKTREAPVSWQLGGARPSDKKDAYGLEEGCMTYTERYARYTAPVKALLPPTRSRIALLLRTLPDKFTYPLRFDQLFAIRALVSEIQSGTGMDVWILVNHEGTENEQREWLDNSAPSEFKSRTLLFSTEQVMTSTKTPRNSSYIENINHDSHMVESWFFNQDVARQYEFIWSVEDDVRVVGSSWQSFFNNVNISLSIEQDAPVDWHSAAFETNTAFPGPNGELPDLVVMRSMLYRPASGGDWGRQCDWTAPENRWNMAVQLWGASRRFHEKSSELYEQGISCFTEHFSISSALHHNLTVRSVEIPLWQREPSTRDTFMFFNELSAPFYVDWQIQPGLCRQGPTLLHPWKNEGTH